MKIEQQIRLEAETDYCTVHLDGQGRIVLGGIAIKPEEVDAFKKGIDEIVARLVKASK